MNGNSFTTTNAASGVWTQPPGYPPHETQPVGQIAGAMQEQEKALLALTEELNALENRIGPFLRPSAPEATGAGAGTPTPLRSDLAQTLIRHNEALFGLIQRARALAARVDI